jgi:hypothetical protein
MSGVRRLWRVAAGALAFALGWGGYWGTARAAGTALHCTNTTSGATWDIPVDLARSEVDSVPAKITDGAISWEDGTYHFYDFDRASGDLEMHVASSTGGFYLTDRCVLK